MGKTFKVHMDFDLDEITTEEHCGCGAPNDTVLDQLNQMFQWVQPSRKKSFNNVLNRNNSNLFSAKNNSLETIESWANYKNHSEEWSGELWSGRAEDIHYDRLGLKHCKLWGIASSSYFETFKTIFLHANIISFFQGSWASSPTPVNMCRTSSFFPSSSSLAPSSHVPSSRTSSTHPFSQPR